MYKYNLELGGKFTFYKYLTTKSFEAAMNSISVIEFPMQTPVLYFSTSTVGSHFAYEATIQISKEFLDFFIMY